MKQYFTKWITITIQNLKERIYDDSKIGVDWKLNNQDLRLSEKDLSLPELRKLKILSIENDKNFVTGSQGQLGSEIREEKKQIFKLSFYFF